MIRYYSIWGDELQPDEMSICDNCKGSIIIDRDIPPDIDDL